MPRLNKHLYVLNFYPLVMYGLQLMANPSVVAVNQSVTLFVTKVTSYIPMYPVSYNYYYYYILL